MPPSSELEDSLPGQDDPHLLWSLRSCGEPLQALPYLHPQGVQNLPWQEEERSAPPPVGHCRVRLPQHVDQQEGQRHVDHRRVWCWQDREHQEGHHLSCHGRLALAPRSLRRRSPLRTRLWPPTPFWSPTEMPRPPGMTTPPVSVNSSVSTSPPLASWLVATSCPICLRSLVSPSSRRSRDPTTSSTSCSSPMVMVLALA